MSDTETPEIKEEILPPKNDPPTVTTSANAPPKKPRSAKQIAWSKESGRRSQELKKRKQNLLNNKPDTPVKPEPQPEPEPEPEREPQIPSENPSENNFSWLVLPTVLVIGGVIVWCKWGKYKVFKPKETPKEPVKIEQPEGEKSHNSQKSTAFSME